MRINKDGVLLEMVKRNLTMEKLAKKLHMSKQGVHVLIYDNRKKQIDTISKLAKGLGLEGDDIDKIVIKEEE